MPEDILRRLGLRMKNARNERGFTQDQLSLISGISVRHIAKIEKGVMNPSFEVLCQLAVALGVSLDTVIYPTGRAEDADLLEIIDLYQACPKQSRSIVKVTLLALVNELRSFSGNGQSINHEDKLISTK